ncbi:MAG: CoA pyrophosphatase [Novosphingobium sp.]
MSSRRLGRLTALFEAGHREAVLDLPEDDARFFAAGEMRDAAVLMAVIDRAEPAFLMIHRPSTMRAHAGQAAFPGGKVDPGEDAVAAALREAHEELGIDPRSVAVIGTTDRYRTATGYDITPVLAMIPDGLALRPNPMEVACWFTPPVDFVLDPANHAPRTGEWEGETREFIEIQWNEHLIWGVTARILANLGRRIAWHG